VRTESAAYKAQRAGWVTQPSKFIKAEYVRRAGDLTTYPFTRDFAEYDVLSPTTVKLKCLKDVRGQSQELNPVAGRSSIGTLEADLVDINREMLKQVSDPARPLRLPVRGRPTIRNSSVVRTMPAQKILYATTWTQSGFASFTAARMNDDVTETTIAFDADAAAAGSTLQLDLGVGVTKAFVGIVVYSAGTGANCTWAIECSDDATTWTTLATGFSTGAAKTEPLTFPYFGPHRYWRLRKTNAATAGPDYYEVQWAEQAVGRNTVMQVDDISGYPTTGHVILEEAGVPEDFSYPSVNAVLNVFNTPTRAARDTIPNDHAPEVLVRNGEQLRRGTRLTLMLGYQPMVEAEYGPGPGYTRMEVQSWTYANLMVTLRCADIQRFVKRKIFELATETNPVNLTGNPITLLLQVWMSTGVGNNGPYDVLVRENGAAVPMALIDIAAWETLRGAEGISGTTFKFSEIEPQDSKDWGETQIMRPLMILPDVNQSGQLTGKLVAQPAFSHSGMATGKIRASA
jgi:hypothetical protein